MNENYYKEKLLVSIKAYYDSGHTSTYYREMFLEDIGKWLEAHTYTHPGVTSYTIKIDTFYMRDKT